MALRALYGGGTAAPSGRVTSLSSARPASRPGAKGKGASLATTARRRPRGRRPRWSRCGAISPAKTCRASAVGVAGHSCRAAAGGFL